MYNFTIDDLAEPIKEMFNRGDAQFNLDDISQTLTIKSRNQAEPLSYDEERQIKLYLALRGCPYKIVFN